MPAFIIAGSTIMPATRPWYRCSVRSSASRSLNGTTRVSATTSSGMPIVCGTDTGSSYGPILSPGGATDTITASPWPW